MKFTKESIDILSDKLLIGLTDEENEMVLKEFEFIDQNINLINEIENINEVEPMAFCLDDFVYELREDIEENSESLDDLLSNCDDYVEREVRVPRMV